MDLEKLLGKERIEVAVDEAEIQTVIRKAKAAFMESESRRILSFHEFIWNQLRMIRKRWWAIQFCCFIFGMALSFNRKRDVLYTPGNGRFCRLVCDYIGPGIMAESDKPLHGS